MQISDIIAIVQNKANHLKSERQAAHNAGNLEGVIKLDQEIEETQATIDRLVAAQ